MIMVRIKVSESFFASISLKMAWLKAVVISIVVTSATCDLDLSFPPGFRFGAASAAYQVEGAWNVSDKTASIWDHLVHTRPSAVADSGNGDVACDSYRLWRRDVEICKELGLHFYRFSMSWPRLLPNGLANHVSEDGRAYYSGLIDELLANGIEPVVTLYHWDLPQSLQELGGWANPLIVDWFGDYARTVYSLFGDRVKTWLTLNEPVVICDTHYNLGLVPNSAGLDLGSYLCNKNLLLAHGKAYRIYDEEFKPQYHGRVSLTNQLIWVYPETESAEDQELAETARQLLTGRYTHAIFSKEGGWPKAVEELVAKNSKAEGYRTSRLPAFTKEEIEFVKGTYDFFGMNHYSSRIVRPLREGDGINEVLFDALPELGVALVKHASWETAACNWFYVNPEGLRHQLAWIKATYGDLEVMIFENGYATKRDNANGLEDVDRIQYYRDYMEQVVLAIQEDSVNVTAYTSWTLLDNFEWMDGYTTQFGLYEVDFASPDRTRTPRKSARYYASVIKANKVIDVDAINDDL